jgi:hypothetical protein
VLGRRIVGSAEACLAVRVVCKVNLLVRNGNEKTLGFYRQLGYGLGAVQEIEKWIDPSKRPDC